MIDKKIIKEHCKTLLLDRIEYAEKAMKAAQESSNSEDKSSAGDKYETGRAMGHLDREMNAKQLAKAQIELTELNKIDLKPNSNIQIGSLVQTENTIYFISVGLGAILVNNIPVVVVSPKSPLAIQLMGKKTGQLFEINGVSTKIKYIG